MNAPSIGLSQYSVRKIISSCASVSPGEWPLLGQRDAQLLRRAGAVFTAVSGTGALSAGWGFVFAWCNKTQHEMLSTGKHHQHFSNCFLSHFPTRNDQKNFLAKYFQEKKKKSKICQSEHFPSSSCGFFYYEQYS